MAPRADQWQRTTRNMAPMVLASRSNPGLGKGAEHAREHLPSKVVNTSLFISMSGRSKLKLQIPLLMLVCQRIFIVLP